MESKVAQLKGLHILGEIFSDNIEQLMEPEPFRKFLAEQVKINNLTSVGEVFHRFGEGGFTGMVCLTESHISIHTWPEFNYLTCDIYLCNFQMRNNEKCERIYQHIVNYFNGKEISSSRLER
jgi:S-adenosylmethionine decarboxylase